MGRDVIFLNLVVNNACKFRGVNVDVVTPITVNYSTHVAQFPERYRRPHRGLALFVNVVLSTT